MPLLPAVVPEIPENRSQVAAARLARKIAPLFGVPWPDGPFAGRTWVCDYAKITLSELARGAPLPSREQAAKLDRPAAGDWSVVDRIGVTGANAVLPNEIANATLNRFGPDTKAAVVLTAVNRLLTTAQAGIEIALGCLVDEHGHPLPFGLRLAAWAGLVVEVFRSQPALVAAGVHARAIQQELVHAWQLPLAAGLDGLPLTRCEVASVPNPRTTASSPCTLDVADRTFAALDLDRRPGGTGDPDAELDDVDGGPAALAGRLRAGESVDLLLRRLLATGTAADASYLWMSERAPGRLAVEALLPPTAVVDRFVRDTQRLFGEPAEVPAVLPAVPSTAELARLPAPARRAVLLAVLTVLRHVQNSPSGRDGTRRMIVPTLTALADRARAVLDEDDPVAAVVVCKAADMTVQTLRPDQREDLRGPLRDLMVALDRCEELCRRGILDRGVAAETISSACVELLAVARTNARDPEAGLPGPDELRARLRRGWRSYHNALEIAPFSTDVGAPRPPAAVGYHLHNYAAFLAGSPDEAELRAAVDLFRDVVIPARAEFFAGSGHFLPLRHSLQVASRATTRLGESALARGEAATDWAVLGRGWVLQALAADETRRLLAVEPPTETACRFALLAAPALLLAAEVGLSGADDVERARSLVDQVSRWETANVGDPTDHTRHAEVAALRTRIAELDG